MTVQNTDSGAGQATSAVALMETAQRLAATYAEARQALPELPADYQSARPWFITLGRLVSQHANINQDRS